MNNENEASIPASDGVRSVDVQTEVNRTGHLFRVVLSVGLSLWWRGYTHGRHREEELLIEGARPVPGRSKKVDAKPKPPR